MVYLAKRERSVQTFKLNAPVPQGSYNVDR